MQKWLLLGAALTFATAPVAAQPAQRAYPVELAMPFGTANGKLVISGDYLIFINDPDVEKSFAISPDNVQDVSIQNGVLSLALNKVRRTGTGEMSRLNFRFTNPGDADAVAQWSKAASADRSTPGSSPDASGNETPKFSYQVKHDHRLGSCTGRLLVFPDRISFESLTDVNDSRQWSMKDIKELEHKSPYKLDIKPFTGNDYSFEFIGDSMKNEDYAELTRAVAAARAAR